MRYWTLENNANTLVKPDAKVGACYLNTLAGDDLPIHDASKPGAGDMHKLFFCCRVFDKGTDDDYV